MGESGGHPEVQEDRTGAVFLHLRPKPSMATITESTARGRSRQNLLASAVACEASGFLPDSRVLLVEVPGEQRHLAGLGVRLLRLGGEILFVAERTLLAQ